MAKRRRSGAVFVDAAALRAVGSSALPVSLAISCIVLAVLAVRDPTWHEWFDYRRSEVMRGEVWRLVTGHLMHWSIAHAALDIAGLLLVAWIFDADFGWRRQGMVCLIGMAVVDFALLALHPALERYVGLSGVLHASFATGATFWLVSRPEDDALVATRRAWGALLLVGLGVKLALETHHRAFWIADLSFPIVTAAHRWGSVAGLVCGLCFASLGPRRRVARASVGSRGR